MPKKAKLPRVTLLRSYIKSTKFFLQIMEIFSYEKSKYNPGHCDFGLFYFDNSFKLSDLKEGGVIWIKILLIPTVEDF